MPSGFRSLSFGRLAFRLVCWGRRRVMYLRKVRTGVRSKHSTMEPVWITCDDLNAEGILVRGAAYRGSGCLMHCVMHVQQCTAALMVLLQCSAIVPGTAHITHSSMSNVTIIICWVCPGMRADVAFRRPLGSSLYGIEVRMVFCY